jgi:hypothetical protein
MHWLLQILIAIDQLGNALLNGYADETLSSRAHRWDLAGHSLPRRVINILFFWQENHCQGAYYDELYRRQLPPEMR